MQDPYLPPTANVSTQGNLNVELDIPIALRIASRECTKYPHSKYPIDQYVSYAHVSPSHLAFLSTTLLGQFLVALQRLERTPNGIKLWKKK